jgi:uncharacterized Zn finger protein (UPF0148 family)
MMPTLSNAHADQAKEQRLAEYRKGGDQMPCPFCNVPRFQRSDYIRCCVCGINWSPNDNLSLDPRLSQPNYKPSGIVRKPAA